MISFGQLLKFESSTTDSKFQTQGEGVDRKIICTAFSYFFSIKNNPKLKIDRKLMQPDSALNIFL